MKKIKLTIRALTVALVFLVLFSFGELTVNAKGYSYDFWKNVIPCTDGLTYRDTYYHGDIENANATDTDPVVFDDPVDLITYESNIYILDSMKFTKTKISNSIKEATGVSSVYILNQDFKKLEKIDEFLITDEVKKTLDDYYDFNLSLSEINKAEYYNSTELISIYKTSTYVTYESSQFILDNNSLRSTVPLTVDLEDGNAKRIIKIGDKKLAKSDWYVTTINEKVIEDGKEVNVTNRYLVLTNKDLLTEGQTVSIEYAERETVGKAPYFPYSKDTNKAAIRLNNASGITVAKSGMYIADSGNSRIIKVNKVDNVWTVTNVYLSPDDNVFYQVSSGITIKDSNTSTLFNPQKIAVDKTGKVFCIAKNVYEGIVEFDSAGSFNRFIGKNEVVANPLKKFWTKIFSEEQVSSIALDLPPEFTNLTIDPSGFLYATSKPDKDATKAEKMVKMINTSGKDVLKRNGYVTPDGDAVYVTASSENGVILGPSTLVGISVSDNGNFTVVDSKRGRLFTYDNEGNLLYITGDQPGGTTSSASTSNIVNPVAIKYFKRATESGEEEILLVLDGSSRSILVFETTEFGEKVNLAIQRYQDGIFENVENEDGTVTYGAEHYWNEVLRMNTNYELAHLGIGKAQYRRGDYKLAMASFKLAHNANYYSKAYSEYRDEVLSKNFAWIMTAIILLIVLWITLSYRKHLIEKNRALAASMAMNEEKYNILSGSAAALNHRDEEEKTGMDEENEVPDEAEEEKKTKKFNIAVVGRAIKKFFYETIAYPMYILTHPIQGFTEFKNEKKAKMWAAISILVLYVLMEIFAYQYEGIITNKNNPEKFNSLQIIIYGVIPPVVLAIANWSVTTLLDGKGRMKEIFMMICYSLVPTMLIGYLNILLSNVLTLDEAQFITLLNIIGWVLTGFMVFMGLVVIHEYGMGKTLWSIILTILAALIIAFIALLIFDLAQQIYGFVYSLYKEITTRYF